MKNNRITQAISNLFNSFTQSVINFVVKNEKKQTKDELLEKNIENVKQYISGGLSQSAIQELAMSFNRLCRHYSMISYRSFQEGDVENIRRAIPYIQGFVKFNTLTVPKIQDTEIEELFNFLDISGDNFKPDSLPMATNNTFDPSVRISVFRLRDEWSTVSIFSVFKDEVLVKSFQIKQQHQRAV